MTFGSEKNVHQPVVLIARSGRNEETSRPNVGSVQRTAMISAASDAHGEVSFFFAVDAAETFSG